ncbi:MAG: hypothetical protein ACT4OZ_13935 [Gemmatimonadota bacterium]
MLIVLLRLVHIVCGVLWTGFATFTAFLLLPAVNDAGPEGGKVMMSLQRRGLTNILPLLGAGTIVPGLWLYWIQTGGFDSNLVRGTGAMVVGTGGLLSIVALGIGLAVVRPSIVRAAGIMRSLEGTSDEGARRAALAEAGTLRARAGSAGRLVAVLLLASAAAMAVARYL